MLSSSRAVQPLPSGQLEYSVEVVRIRISQVEPAPEALPATPPMRADASAPDADSDPLSPSLEPHAHSASPSQDLSGSPASPPLEDNLIYQLNSLEEFEEGEEREESEANSKEEAEVAPQSRSDSEQRQPASPDSAWRTVAALAAQHS